MASLAMAMTRSAQVGDTLVTVTWNPPEYERAAMRATPLVTEEDLQEMSDVMGEHMTVMVIGMNLGSDATGDTTLGENLRERIRIHAPDGQFYEPLDPEELDPELREMSEFSLEDMPDLPEGTETPFDFRSMMRRMQTFVFPAVADPTEEGRFTVLIDDVKFVWDLPIPELLPPMVNPETGQEFPGNFRFDFVTGAELVPAQR